jgi:hypothetical protein
MSKTRCTKKGGTLKEACRAIFACVIKGQRNEYYTYECEICGKHHITTNPK